MSIVLDKTTRSLAIVLAGATNTNDCPFVCSFTDTPPGSPLGRGPADGANTGNSNGVTAVTVMPAPPDGYQRKMKSFNLNNADLAAITISIQYVDGANTFVLFKITLQTLEQLMYEEGFGFDALDQNGAIKSQAAATSSATSTAQSTASLASSQASSIAAVNPASVSSQASSLAAAENPTSLNSVSSQASSMAALTPASVSSQASSMAALVPASVSSQASSLASGIVIASLNSVSVNGSTATSNQSLGSSAGWSVTLSKTKSSFGF